MLRSLVGSEMCIRDSCQPCFPLHLEFSEKCNQCLPSNNDQCVSSAAYSPVPTYYCPDLCPRFGADFSGNIADPYNNKHYLACWKGATLGCIPCPSELEFNADWNACLYKGLFKTKPAEYID